MPSIRDDALYRRGVVLGLTMAELLLLLLFVLMLAMSLLVRDRTEEIARQQERLDQRNSEIAALSERLDQLVRTNPSQQSYSDVFRELVLVREQRNLAQQKVAALQEKVEQAEQKAEQAQREAELVEAVERALGEIPSADQITDVLTERAQAERIIESAREAGLPTDDEALQQALEEAGAMREALSDAAGAAETAEERLAYFKRRHGLSNEMPPCWIHPKTKRAEYIYDVVLEQSGIIVFARDLPHRREDKKSLPLGAIETRTQLSPGTFARNVSPLYRWSVEQECRFYVRVFDRTPADAKQRYKILLRRVEGYFYKWLVTDPSAVPGRV